MYLFVRGSGLEDVLHVSAHVDLSQEAIALIQHEVLHLIERERRENERKRVRMLFK